VKTDLIHLRRSAPYGKRLVMDAPFGSWGTQKCIAELRPAPMIAPWVVKGAMDGAAFAAYIQKVLIPELAPGTVVILDNLATYKKPSRPKRCATLGASSYPWHLTAWTVIPSKWLSQDSRPTSGVLVHAPSPTRSMPSQRSETSTLCKNAETTSSLQRMPQVNGAML
jgi:hypothetical protein